MFQTKLALALPCVDEGCAVAHSLDRDGFAYVRRAQTPHHGSKPYPPDSTLQNALTGRMHSFRDSYKDFFSVRDSGAWPLEKKSMELFLGSGKSQKLVDIFFQTSAVFQPIW